MFSFIGLKCLNLVYEHLHWALIHPCGKKNILISMQLYSQDFGMV